MKNLKDLQSVIKNRGGFIISEASLKLEDLLDAAYGIITQYNLSQQLKGKIERWFDEGMDPEEGSYLFYEEVFYLFNKIAPDGYCFGSHPGDGACFGWFYDDEMDW